MMQLVPALQKTTSAYLLESGRRVDSAGEALKEPSGYAPELVSRAVMEVQRRYRPKTLATVSAEQDWALG